MPVWGGLECADASTWHAAPGGRRRASDELERPSPTQELVANLRADTLLRWATPGGGYHGALNHVVVHGLDATVPLGLARRTPDETIRFVLTDLTEGGMHEHFGTDISGRRLEASDLDWSHGSSGSVLRAKAEDLALIICGRTVPAGRLDGQPL